MDKLRKIRHQMVQQTLQAVGAAEETDDEEFKNALATNKDNADQLAAVAKHLGRYKESLVASLEAASALTASLEVYFAPEVGNPPSDPASFKLAQLFSSVVGEMKSAALPATGDMLAASRSSIEKSHEKFGDIAPRVATRKAVLVEFDSYKRKVEALRAAPPKNDADKLPRNEEKLTKACTDLAAANDELISKLVELERAKASMLSADLRNIIDASYLFFQQAEIRMERVSAAMAELEAESKAGAAKPKHKPTPPPPTARPTNDFGDDEPPVMEFKPTVHVAAAPPPPPPPRGPPPGMDDDDPFGAPSKGSHPPPPPPPPAAHAAADDSNPFETASPAAPKAAGGGVLGVDDFDAFA